MADDDERSDEDETTPTRDYCQETTNTNTTSLVDLESPPTIAAAPPLSFNDNDELQSSNSISTNNFFVRPIQPQDREIIQQLHEEWFPVDYQSEFYDDLVLGKICHTGEDLYTRVVLDTTTATTGDDNHKIVACIVAARIPFSRLNRKSRELLLPPNVFGIQRHSSACYIMTLGTIPDYRKLGLATMLVQQCVQDLIVPDETCGALYLHVITSNQRAIRFYEERLGFFQVQEISNYYTIDEEFHNCYLYAKYFHGTCVLGVVLLSCCLHSVLAGIITHLTLPIRRQLGTFEFLSIIENVGSSTMVQSQGKLWDYYAKASESSS